LFVIAEDTAVDGYACGCCETCGVMAWSGGGVGERELVEGCGDCCDVGVAFAVCDESVAVLGYRIN
jgi:hypothetical protein